MIMLGNGWGFREVMEFVEWGPTPGNLFSKTGCKRLSQKIAMLIQKHNLVPKKKPELW